MQKREIREYTAVYTLGSLGYSGLEVLWRGFTHWTMSVTGGVCFLLLYLVDLHTRGWGLVKKCLVGSGIITAVEFLVGSIVNRWLKWKVWDYSKMPFQFRGQICLFFSVMWFLLCIPAFWLAARLHHGMFSCRRLGWRG